MSDKEIVERLYPPGWEKTPYEELRAENERLRAALQRIVDEADSDDGLTAWDGGDIARSALADQGKGR